MEKGVEYLYTRNNSTPILHNNQIHSQGYFKEIRAFVDAVEDNGNDIVSSIEATRDVYMLIEAMKQR